MVEWGVAPIVIAKEPIDAAVEVRPGYYELVFVNCALKVGAACLMETPFPDPKRTLSEIYWNLREMGVRPVYIKVEGSRAYVIYEAAGTPGVWSVVALLIAVGIVLGLVLMLVGAFRLTVARIGPWEIKFGDLVLIGLGVIALAALAALLK